jgi:hypothetical protein
MSAMSVGEAHRTPVVLWAQRKDRLFVTIECANAENPKVNLTDDGVLTFSAMAGTDSTEEKHPYDLRLELMHPVNANDSKIHVGSRHIVVIVMKTEEVSGRAIANASLPTLHVVDARLFPSRRRVRNRRRFSPPLARAAHPSSPSTPFPPTPSPRRTPVRTGLAC